MIKISSSKGCISINGHAGYDVQGKDIVCAAVSVLAQNLIMSIERLTEDKIKYSISAGKLDINYEKLSDRAQVLLASFFIGIEAIANEYPQYVKLSKH